MTTTQLKSAIQKELENLPDGALQEILQLLKQLQPNSTEKKMLTEHLGKILSEDKELLEKLAQ